MQQNFAVGLVTKLLKSKGLLQKSGRHLGMITVFLNNILKLKDGVFELPFPVPGFPNPVTGVDNQLMLRVLLDKLVEQLPGPSKILSLTNRV